MQQKVEGGESESHKNRINMGMGMGEGESISSDQLVEAASPISSRPPPPPITNMDDLMGLSELAAAGTSSGGGGGGGASNRWPRQETLALLKIRSDMDAAFRDATLKAPLWDHVSRKLAELGYKRSAKKCKEKFENVHKYYKRTKEGRAGRQDGKTYKFFSELEALQGSQVQGLPLPPPNSAVGCGSGIISNPMPISSFRSASIINAPTTSASMPIHFPTADDPSQFISSSTAPMPPPPPPPPPPTATGNTNISFSSNSSSSSPGSEDDDDDDDVAEGEPSTSSAGIKSGSRKRRKRSSDESWISGHTSSMMMEFFENLMRQVMQKQEEMQQRFLEVIEKREKERMIREEAWKRQEMARLSREHEVMSQERAISASRDASIVSFLQKITGQTIQLPQSSDHHLHHVLRNNVNSNNPPPPPPPPPVVVPQEHVVQRRHAAAGVCMDVVMAVPEQQVPPQPQGQPQEQALVISTSSKSNAPNSSSSRWPKAEVLALIKLRSEMECRYLESVPKGPLWEEISAKMQQMGYMRSSKRCKEKWENINKYFKKVKESSKKRPEDAKTCPYFHQLDALHRNKLVGSSSLYNQNRTGNTIAITQQAQHDQETTEPNKQQAAVDQPENTKTSPAEDQGTASSAAPSEKPEDIVKELRHDHQQLAVHDYDEDEDELDELDELEKEEQEDEEEAEEAEAMKNMGWYNNKIEHVLQRERHNSNNGNGNIGGAGGVSKSNGATTGNDHHTPPAFFAMVQ